ncbi:MAG: helix-turn-helix transcriptional regulator [Paludibacter sp.]|jgi:DNA-binding transcriptional regulator YiaG|nr:helix-turn-helix transcriptional regulator [Paludibacter sp.]
MEIAMVIKSIRKELGLSQKAFADAIHLSFSTINRWENGRAKPNRLASVTIVTLAKDRGVSPSLISDLEALLHDDIKG